MPTVRLTRRFIAALPTPAVPTTYYDDTLAGFGLAVRPSGSRSFIVEFRPGGGGRGVAKKRLRLGDPETMTPEEARAAAKAILARVTRGEDPATERAEARAAKTVAEVCEAWLTRHVGPKRKPNTLASYRGTMRCHVIPALGTRKAATLTRADVLRLHEAIAAKAEASVKGVRRGATKGKGRGGAAVANKAVVLLKAMLSWAADAGLLPEDAKNPAARVELFAERERQTFLDAGHRARLGEALALAESSGLPSPSGRVVKFDVEAVAALRVLALSGCRLREVLHAQWSNLDIARGTLWLPDAKRGPRSVDLGPSALAVIRALPRKGVYIFASSSAGTDTERPRADLKRVWGAVSAHAGLPKGTRIHDLRHNAGQRAAESGRSLHEVAALLGHSQEKTARRYARFSPSATKSIAEGVSAMLAADFGMGAEVVDLAQRRARP